MNDPNGFIKWGDTYHLFYQYNPHAPSWARPYWGHATSDDLVSWTHLPVALEPTGLFDSSGCFSGVCVDNGGVPTIIYTGVVADPQTGYLVERVLMATSADELHTWTKRDAPLIDAPPANLNVVGFRDPFVWKHQDGKWRMIIGAGDPLGGMVLIYSSHDLFDWIYLGVFLHQNDLEGDPLVAARVWECPQYLRLPDRDVLLLSILLDKPDHVVIVEGEVSDETFVPLRTTVMDVGKSLYAPHLLDLGGGHNLVLGWLQETDSDARPAGWVGAMSLPRTIMSAANGAIGQRIAISPLANQEAEDPPRPFAGNIDISIGAAPQYLSIDLSAHEGTIAKFTLDGMPSGDGISTDAAWYVACTDGQFVLSDEPPTIGPTANTDAHTVTVDVVVDNSIVEVFCGSGPTYSHRFYPSGATPNRLRISTSDASRLRARVSSGTIAAGTTT